MVAGSSRRSAAFFVRAFDAAISGLPGLGKKAIGLATRRFNQILTQNIRHSKPGTVIDVVTCRPCKQGVSDGFFRALLCRPHRRGIFGRDRCRDLDVDALSRAVATAIRALPEKMTAAAGNDGPSLGRKPAKAAPLRKAHSGPARVAGFVFPQLRGQRPSKAETCQAAFLDSANAYPGQSSPVMYAARRSSAALAQSRISAIV
jgi:hypothetical protein